MNGNIVSVRSKNKTTSYVYDSANQLIRENNEALGKTWTWEYDAAGNILTKKEYDYTTADTLGTASDTFSYVYDTGAWGDLLKAFDGQNYYASGQLLKMYVTGYNLFFAYDAAGTPMSVYYDGAHYSYVTNQQGDVVAILDNTGTAVVTYAYDAWGNILDIGGADADTLGVYNPLRYRGYVYDQEANKLYLCAIPDQQHSSFRWFV